MNIKLSGVRHKLIHSAEQNRTEQNRTEQNRTERTGFLRDVKAIFQVWPRDRATGRDAPQLSEAAEDA